LIIISDVAGKFAKGTKYKNVLSETDDMRDGEWYEWYFG